jgi:hypothetical protein
MSDEFLETARNFTTRFGVNNPIIKRRRRNLRALMLMVQSTVARKLWFPARKEDLKEIKSSKVLKRGRSK